VTVSTIFKLEADQRQPLWPIVVALAAGLGCATDDFLGDEDLKRMGQARAGGDQGGKPAPNRGRRKS
jgi:hypothetical protein